MKTTLKFLVLFSVVIFACSFLFSFSSWGQRESGIIRRPQISSELILHEIEHAVFGAIVALPTLKTIPILAASITAVLFDADHIGYYLGLPLNGRASHSVIFLLIAFVVIYFLAKKAIFRPYGSQLKIAVLGLSAILAHLAFDGISADGFPLLAPFSYQTVFITSIGGISIEIATIMLVAAMEVRNKRNKI